MEQGAPLLKVDLKDPVAIARMCADEGIAAIKFDAKGQVVELALSAHAFNMASDRRNAAAAAAESGDETVEDPAAPKVPGRQLAKHRRAAAGKLPTVGGNDNPLRRQKQKEERDNVSRINFQKEDEKLLYAHTEGD